MNVPLVLIRKHTCRQSNPTSVSLLSTVDSLPFVLDNALCEIYFSTLVCNRLQFCQATRECFVLTSSRAFDTCGLEAALTLAK